MDRFKKSDRRTRHAALELLEDRSLLAGVLPCGASPDDTAEYMLGTVAVSVVLMESDATLAPRDRETENWTSQLIEDTKTKIEAGLHWWKDMLSLQSSVLADHLRFEIDYAYADAPVHTGYEPIARRSDDFQYWMYDFLDKVGFNSTHDFSEDIRAFNNAQRLARGTDWAFTIFVVNSANDPDDAFAFGGSFSQAFSYAGGRFMVVPSGRPASTYAHEAGHEFWALDEYAGSYTKHRGYYDTQNLNAPHSGYTQQPSIMASGSLLDTAYTNHVNAQSTLNMVGWEDSDGDGIFDVLDVPHTLTGTGFVDSDTGQYRFVGSSSVETLPNLNPSGLQNDITINKIDRAQYSIDGGPWQTAAEYHTDSASLDLHVPLPDSGPHTIQVRTIDDTTGVTSATFQGETSRPDSVLQPGISGFVWRDTNGNASFDSGDGRLSGWTIRLSDAVGQPLSASDRLEPDDFPDGTLLNNPTGHPQVTLTGLGDSDGAVRAGTDARASTGSQVFQVHMQSGAWTSSWSDTTQLRADFSSPVSGVQLDAIGTHADAVARLEAYDAAGRLLARYTTRALGLGGVETMVISRLTSDVAYVVASGHGGSAADADTSVHLDNLRCGAETAATTDAQGSYRFVGLSPGTYTAEAVPPNGVLPLTNTQVVTLAASATGQPVEPAAHVDFAVPTSPPTADLVDPKAAGTPFDWQLNVRRYLEVTFNDVNKAGLDISTILSSQPKFTLKGAGAGNVAVRWTPTLVSGTTYRFPFTGTFTNGPVNVNFVAGSFADALGNLNEASTQSFIVRFQPSLWLDTPQPVREGSKRQKTLNVPVRLSGPIAGTITVKYATANGTAIAGKDYKATRGTLTFGPKMPRAQFIKVPILDDRKHENTETFQIKLFSPKGKVAVPVAVGAATGRILDNDPKPRLSVASAPVREGNSGTTKATFPTALPAAGILTATVSRATGKGTATLSGLLDTQSASTLARSGRDALFGGPESDWLLNLPPDARGQRSPNEG